MQPTLTRALTGRAWSYAMLSIAALSLPASFGALLDAGWSAPRSLLGAVLGALLLVLAGVAVQHRARQGPT